MRGNVSEAGRKHTSKLAAPGTRMSRLRTTEHVQRRTRQGNAPQTVAMPSGLIFFKNCELRWPKCVEAAFSTKEDS